MEREGLVQDVEIDVDGQTHRATYFIDNGTIHASVDSKIYLLPLGPGPASDTIKSLMAEKLRRKGFRETLARKWFPYAKGRQV